MEVNSRKLQQLYIVFFGRPADPPGIQYWLSKVISGIQLKDIAKHLSIQDEYKKNYHAWEIPRFSDLAQLVPIILQLIFLISPILYRKENLGDLNWITKKTLFI